jgi:hypothetical protein
VGGGKVGGAGEDNTKLGGGGHKRKATNDALEEGKKS